MPDPFLDISMDHWPEIEIDQLRDDLECAEQERDKAEKKMLATMVVARRNKRDFTSLKKTMDDKIAESNGEITKKNLIYIDLISEYERLINVYVSNSQVVLTTTKLKQLRTRGGLSI